MLFFFFCQIFVTRWNPKDNISTIEALHQWNTFAQGLWMVFAGSSASKLQVKWSLFVFADTESGDGEECMLRCSHCESSYPQIGALRSHMEETHPDKPNKNICDKCGAAFVLRTQLEKHLTFHSPTSQVISLSLPFQWLVFSSQESSHLARPPPFRFVDVSIVTFALLTRQNSSAKTLGCRAIQKRNFHLTSAQN